MKSVSYFESFNDAISEVRSRRSADKGEGLITKIEESPYGGFKVISVPAELLVEEATEGFGLESSRKNPFSQKFAF